MRALPYPSPMLLTLGPASSTRWTNPPWTGPVASLTRR